MFNFFCVFLVFCILLFLFILFFVACVFSFVCLISYPQKDRSPGRIPGRVNIIHEPHDERIFFNPRVAGSFEAPFCLPLGSLRGSVLCVSFIVFSENTKSRKVTGRFGVFPRR